MRVQFLVLPLAFLLMGCPSKDEIKKMQLDLSNKRQVATDVITAGSFDLTSLMKAQEYFFAFAERVQLIRTEPEALKYVENLLGKKGGAKDFCLRFVLQMETWKVLNTYCQGGSFYRCSPEMREYAMVLRSLTDALSKESQKALVQEGTCQL